MSNYFLFSVYRNVREWLEAFFVLYRPFSYFCCYRLQKELVRKWIFRSLDVNAACFHIVLVIMMHYMNVLRCRIYLKHASFGMWGRVLNSVTSAFIVYYVCFYFILLSFRSCSLKIRFVSYIIEDFFCLIGLVSACLVTILSWSCLHTFVCGSRGCLFIF